MKVTCMTERLSWGCYPPNNIHSSLIAFIKDMSTYLSHEMIFIGAHFIFRTDIGGLTVK